MNLSDFLNIYVFLCFFIVLASIITNSMRFKVLLSALHSKISLFSSFLITNFAQFTNFLAPFKIGAVLGKPVASKLVSNVPFNKSFTALFFEQYFEIMWEVILFFFLIIYLGGSFFYNNLLASIFSILIILALFLMLALSYKKIIFFLFKFKRFIPKRLSKHFGRVDYDEVISDISSLFSNRSFFFQYSILLLIRTLIGPLVIYFLAISFSFPLSFMQSFAVYWFSLVVGRISGLPAGLGSKDVTVGALLVYFSISLEVSVKISVLLRILESLPHVAIGGFLFFYYGGIKTLKLFKKPKKSS